MQKILIYGDIDMNVIDGSSIWIISILKTLSQNRNNKVSLLLKRPIEKWILLNSVITNSNIELIDCWQRNFDYNEINSTKSGKAKVLLAYDAVQIIRNLDEKNNYDTILIRGNNLIEELVKLKDTAGKTIIYGLEHFTDVLGGKEEKKKNELIESIKYLACQTEELAEYFLKLGVSKDKLFILPLMIPNFNPTSISIKRNGYKLIYAGKFSPLYNTLEILQAFDRISLTNPQCELLMVGSKFYNQPYVEHFEERVKKHIKTNSNIHFLFGVSREKVLNSVAAYDICISWRSEQVNESLELSTKLLEYGSLGKPVILNKNRMHERLLGKDYPLFANCEDEFIGKVELCLSSEEIYKTSAERVFKTSQNYTFKKVYEKISKYFELIL